MSIVKKARPSLKDGKKIEKHFLTTKISCPITSHHLISFNLFDKVSSRRKKQISDHKYNRDAHENLILIPSKDKVLAKKVACYYGLPWHSSGHTGKNIINHWGNTETERLERKAASLKAEKNVDPFDPSNMQSKGNALTKEELQMYNKDIKKLKKTSGYHKVVASLFFTVLKKLKCNQTNVEYQGHLECLSLDICEYISYFELLLSNPGYDFSPNQVGCQEEHCIGRTHETENEAWPSKENVNFELKIDQRLKLVSEI